MRGRQLGRALLAAVGSARGDGALLERALHEDAEELIRRAAHHRVIGFVERASRNMDVPTRTRDVLRTLVDRQTNVNLRMTLDLALLTKVLDGLAYAIVKGPAVAATLYEDPILRPYHDIDVLVGPRDLRAAVAALVSAGARLLDRNWSMLTEVRAREIHLRLPAGTICDLHWSLVPSPILPHVRLDASELLARSRPIVDGPVAFRTTDPVDTVVHLAMHAATTGGDRLIWIMDIDRASRYTPPADLRERCLASGTSMFVATMMHVGDRVFGRDGDRVPALPLGAWAAVLRAAAVTSPIHACDGSGSVHRMVMRSVRTGPGSSLRELRRHALAWRPGSDPRSRAVKRTERMLSPGDEAVRFEDYLDVVGGSRGPESHRSSS